ncbi:putative metallo-hydrolase [Pseudovibrio sp. Ad37]|nr:putative metallo-hydrolase [Pseudovibrio sp. Ad37]
MVHVIGDAAFAGDTLFMPDSGTARADFPGGDASVLYASIHKVLSLPDEMRLFMCHDYGANGREILFETTVAAEKAENIHVGNSTSREKFVEMREARDATLDVPNLIVPSIQVNMRAGRLPEAENETGQTYLKVPVNVL